MSTQGQTGAPLPNALGSAPQSISPNAPGTPPAPQPLGPGTNVNPPEQQPPPLAGGTGAPPSVLNPTPQPPTQNGPPPTGQPLPTRISDPSAIDWEAIDWSKVSQEKVKWTDIPHVQNYMSQADKRAAEHKKEADDRVRQIYADANAAIAAAQTQASQAAQQQFSSFADQYSDQLPEDARMRIREAQNQLGWDTLNRERQAWEQQRQVEQEMYAVAQRHQVSPTDIPPQFTGNPMEADRYLTEQKFIAQEARSKELADKIATLTADLEARTREGAQHMPDLGGAPGSPATRSSDAQDKFDSLMKAGQTTQAYQYHAQMAQAGIPIDARPVQMRIG